MINQVETATQGIQTKYNEFQKACKTILPKVDRKLIEDLLFRQQKDPDREMTPRYTLEVITTNNHVTVPPTFTFIGFGDKG